MRIIVTLLALFMLSACGTTQVDVRYAPSTTIAQSEASPIIVVSQVTDDRKAGPNWLGAIRGGFGNPLKTLTTREPVRDLVAHAFSDALSARGLLATSAAGRYELAVSIRKFDCSQMMRREAHAWFDLTLRERATGRTVYAKATNIDKVVDQAAFDSGVLAAPEDLLKVALDAMNEAIDTALAAPELRTALRSTPI